MAKRYDRQIGIINVNDYQENKIAIIGCGAVGSYVAVSLAKMGLQKFALYDFDKVEEHNLPNQFFTESDIGLRKAKATRDWMQEFNEEVEVETFGEYKGQKLDSQIVICCVDKMKARKVVFDACKRDKVQLFIDTRMAGLQGQVYNVDMTSKKRVALYEETLFTDEEAVQERCTERAIIFTVLGVASLVCNTIVQAYKGYELKNFITLDYTLPQMI